MTNVGFINQCFTNKISDNNYFSVPKTLSFKGKEDVDEVQKRKQIFISMFQKELEETKTVFPWDIEMLCQMDTKKAIQTAKLMKKYETDFFGAELIQNLPEDRKQEAFSYLDENIPIQYIKFLLNLDDETAIKRAKEIVKLFNFTNLDIVRLIYLKENDYQTCLKFLNATHGNVDETLALIHFKGENSEKALELTKKGFKSNEIRNILQQGENAYNRALELSEIEDLEKYKIPFIITFETIHQQNNTPFSTERFTHPDITYEFLTNLLSIYFTNKQDIKAMSFDEKLQLNRIINEIKNHPSKDKLLLEEEKQKVKDLSMEIKKSLKIAIQTTQVQPQEIVDMMSYFFRNDDELENLLKTADFTQFQKQGLPLKYSRHDYLADLSKLLELQDTKTKEKIFKKLDIKPVYKDEKLTGYDGIINLKELNPEDELENSVLDISYKFIRENRVQTNNEELNKALNSLIQGMGEFVNIIGKTQNSNHEYSLDIHILKALQEALRQAEYQELDNVDKTVLKFAIILHDIAKAQDVVDNNHAQSCALYVRNILNKYSLSQDIKERICELVKNHHWLEEHNSSKADDNYIASLFRYKNDFKLAKIFAKADLKAVNNYWHEGFKYALETKNFSGIEKALDKINSTGQLLFSSKIVNKKLIPTVRYHNQNYKVIDFTKMPPDFDLGQVGFMPNTKPSDIRLLAHVAQNAADLDNAKYLDDILNGGLLCASYISLDKCPLYLGLKFAIGLETNNHNIANAFYQNQKSSVHKDFNRFSNIITSQDNISEYRQPLVNSIKKELGLSDKEYVALYKKLSLKTHLTQIKDNEIIFAEDKKLIGSKVKLAIQRAQDSLLNSNTHNEVNLYKPRITSFIAKVNSLDEIPQEFLDFAHENNLVIYLIGE